MHSSPRPGNPLNIWNEDRRQMGCYIKLGVRGQRTENRKQRAEGRFILQFFHLSSVVLPLSSENRHLKPDTYCS
jgi:hypothetical protein